MTAFAGARVGPWRESGPVSRAGRRCACGDGARRARALQRLSPFSLSTHTLTHAAPPRPPLLLPPSTTETSAHAALNLPLAIAVVLGVKWAADGATAAARARAMRGDAAAGRSPSGAWGGGGLYLPPGQAAAQQQAPPPGRPPLARSTGSVTASLAGWGVTAATPPLPAPPAAPLPPIPPLPLLPASQRSGADPSPAADAAWRAAVGEPAVIAAWEGISGGIVQEFIYDAWWGGLTPDTAFPASVRAALNSAFGELAAAARGIDVRRVALVDAVDLVADHLLLFRDARAAVAGSLPGGKAAWAALPPAARERALARELRASGNLHPALLPPGAAAAAGGAPCGHHAVLSRIGSGLAACLLTRPDFNHPALRPLIGELLASAVLKPIVMLFAPHSIARMALNALRGADARQREAAAAVAAATAAAAAGAGDAAAAEGTDSGHIGKPAGATTMPKTTTTSLLFPTAAASLHPTQGAWEFEARVRRSAGLEAARAAGKADRGAVVGAPLVTPVGVSSPAPAWARAQMGGQEGGGGGFHSPTTALARSASEQGLSSLHRGGGCGGDAAVPADSLPASTRGLTPLRRRGRAGTKSGRAGAAGGAAEGGGLATTDGRLSSSNPSSPERRGRARPPASSILRPEGGGSEGSEATSVGGGGGPPPTGPSLLPVGPSRLAAALGRAVSPPPPPPGRAASASPTRGLTPEAGSPARASGSGDDRGGGGGGASPPPPPLPRPPAAENGSPHPTLAVTFAALPPPLLAARQPPAATAARRAGGWQSYGRPGAGGGGGGGGEDPLGLASLRAAAAAAGGRVVEDEGEAGEEAGGGAPATAGTAIPPRQPASPLPPDAAKAAAAATTPTTPTAAAAAAAAALPPLPTGWADRAPLPASATGPAAAGYYGFLGTPTASVVAAHVDTSGTKDVALFLVRVADGRGEWAVARRHRHFEAMHRALKEVVPGYRLRPPTKRSLLGGVSHAPEAVEERRRGLDAFLWRVLADPSLAGRREVWDFLSAWGGAPVPDGGSGLARAVSTVGLTLRGASTPLRRAAGAVAAGAAGAAGAVGGAVGDLVDLVGGGGGDRDRGDEDGGRTPNAAARKGGAGGRGGGGGAAHRGPSPTPTPRRGRPPPGGRAASASATARGSPSSSDGDDSAHPAARRAIVLARLSPEGGGGGSSVGSAGGGGGGGGAGRGGHPHPRAASSPPSLPHAAPQARLDADGASPPPADPAFTAPAPDVAGAPDDGHLGHLGAAAPDNAHAQAAHAHAAPALDPAAVQVTTAAAAAGAGFPASPGRTPAWWEGAVEAATGHGGGGGHRGEDGWGALAAGDEWAGAAGGVAGPLYELVGSIFDLDRRGFFRRQVLGVARQLLSLVAGGAIDDWLLGRLAAAREPGSVAAGVRRLRGILWPGGVFITRAVAAAAAGLPPGAPLPPPPPGPPRALTEATFLDPAAAAPADAAEVAAELRARLLADPPAWARLIGRGAYASGVGDVLDMVASPTFALSLGYGAVRLVLAALFPRLKPLLADVERAAAGVGAGAGVLPPLPGPLPLPSANGAAPPLPPPPPAAPVTRDG